MKCVITGVAGFIGSHLAEKMLEEGWDVWGIDSLEPFYPRWLKEWNLEALKSSKRFVFFEEDIMKMDAEKILDGASFIFHLAAQPGVIYSWGKNFEIYVKNNILTTQRLLEEIKDKDIKFVYISSSSVYGDSPIPMREENLPSPVSPYGVTKLAGEKLVELYSKNYGVRSVIFRYFSVYGPRQRPDMAFHKFLRAIEEKREIEIYGDGKSSRDFTYVKDIVEGTYLGREKEGIYNLGSGKRYRINEVLEIIHRITGKEAKIKKTGEKKGEIRHTLACIEKAKEFGYNPKTSLEAGIEKEWEWIKEMIRREKCVDSLQ
ncbi:UDP-glucose 4-epimerase [bacterium]|nr:MAG: UDP-glucose 4-epimerase [bacterium]